MSSLDSDTRSPEPLPLDWATPTERVIKEWPLSVWQGEITKRAQQEAAAGNTEQIDAFKKQCERLIGFTEYRFPRYRTAAHHRLIAEQLERVEKGEIERLMS
jgi:hypothetical protein